MQIPVLPQPAATRQRGSAVVEYALVVAVVSLVLVLALGNTLSGLPATMVQLATTVSACVLSTTGTC